MEAEWKEIDGQKYYKFDRKIDEQRMLWGNLLIMLFILVLIGLGVMLFLNFKQIQVNPLTYGITKIAGDYPTECSCYILRENDERVNFFFNKTTFWDDRSKQAPEQDIVAILNRSRNP